MIQKQDLILLLTELQDNGVEIKSQLSKVISSTSIPLDVLKFINEQRPLEVTEFYKHIRKNYNNKKSKLYKNIVGEIKNPNDVLTTLASFALQTLLYSDKVENKQRFLKQTRFEEVERCLANYAKTYDLVTCQKLLYLIRSDLKAVESIYRNA